MKDLGLLQLLRYALSGGIGMAVLFLTCPAAAKRVLSMDATKETTLILGAVLLTGAVIYNIHRAIIYPLLLRVLGFLVPGWNPGTNWNSSWNIFRPSEAELAIDRWRWMHSTEKRQRWDEWGAQTHSLYCAAWAICVAQIVGSHVKGSGVCEKANCQPHWISGLLVTALVAGLVSNYRLMFSLVQERREFPDPRELESRPVNETIASPFAPGTAPGPPEG